jgi:hypothetical protein
MHSCVPQVAAATVALNAPDSSVLFCASNTERAENAGSVPEKRFILIDRMLSDGSSGMLPDMLLFATMKVVRFFILTAHERGIDPKRKLLTTSNCEMVLPHAGKKSGSVPSSSEPLKKLSEISNSRSFEQADRFDGSVPVN